MESSLGVGPSPSRFTTILIIRKNNVHRRVSKIASAMTKKETSLFTGYESSAAVTCPYEFNSLSYYYYDYNLAQSCGPSNSSLDGCTATNTLSFNYSACTDPSIYMLYSSEWSVRWVTVVRVHLVVSSAPHLYHLCPSPDGLFYSSPFSIVCPSPGDLFRSSPLSSCFSFTWWSVKIFTFLTLFVLHLLVCSGPHLCHLVCPSLGGHLRSSPFSPCLLFTSWSIPLLTFLTFEISRCGSRVLSVLHY